MIGKSEYVKRKSPGMPGLFQRAVSSEHGTRTSKFQARDQVVVCFRAVERVFTEFELNVRSFDEFIPHGLVREVVLPRFEDPVNHLSPAVGSEPETGLSSTLCDLDILRCDLPVGLHVHDVLRLLACLGRCF